MSSIQAYLHLRVRLLLRLLREIGVVRLALLGPLLALALARGMVLALTHAGFEWAVPLLTAQLLAAAHRGRADLRFLAISAPGFRRWLAVEYALVALPLALVLGVALLLPMHPAYPVLLLVAVGGLIWQSRRRLRAVLGLSPATLSTSGGAASSNS